MRLVAKYYIENYEDKNKKELIKDKNYESMIKKINNEIDYYYNRCIITDDEIQIKEYKKIIKFLNERKGKIFKVNRK